jgi:hypothetical protein
MSGKIGFMVAAGMGESVLGALANHKLAGSLHFS